jgi:hypothetical protein
VVALLRGLVDHWDELTAEGQRFTCGGYGKPFASPLTTDFVPLLARLGLAVGTRKTGGTGIWTSGTAFDDPRPILAREDAINRLAMDDQYWQRFVMSP